MDVKLRPFARGIRAHRRRVSLAVSFGVVSLVLTLAFGAVFALQIERTTDQRSVRDLKTTTASAVALTANLIVSTVSPHAGRPESIQEKLAQVRLITSASQVLVREGDAVGAQAALPDGTVIGGAGAATAGTKLPLDENFRSALQGRTQTRILHRSAPESASPVERNLLRLYGDLVELNQGVRLASGTPVLVVVQAYAAMRPSQLQAASDTRRTVGFLALGLLMFWAVLFRLVRGASRTLTRQSQDNAYQATHDSLTRLPNRTLLRDRVERAIAASHRTGVHVALLLLDLDGFREINDTLGHRFGDALLREIGPRLREQLRESDTLARLGGDEFVVLLPDLRSPQAAVDVAEKLLAALAQPFLINGAAVDVGCSVGAASTPENGEDFDLLLQHTDVAMYVAKKDNLGVVLYEPSLDSHSPSRLALLGELRRAADQSEQIVLHYQPKANLSSGEVTGVEALVRWQHPQHGLLSPAEFIPLAERTGIIRPLTWCILRKALEQNRSWAEDGLLLRVAVNISARCLQDSGFPDEVVRLLSEVGVPADRLELELTESAVMTDPDRALIILRALDASGIRLAIDDFGTGYSSMAYLKTLPVREIKIDRTFVTCMDRDESDAAIVRSSLELARNLHLDVVAEGVETAEVWRQLSDLGCGSAQGYFLSRPLPAADFRRWLAARATSARAGVTG
jgi:diguanylate cyclase (GGDEF)-like protein